MKSSLKLIAAILVVAILFTSCKSKTNDWGKMIPTDAVFVLHVDGKSLSSKVDTTELMQSEWFKELEKDSSRPEWMRNLHANMGRGIKQQGEFVFFMQNSAAGEMQFVVEGEIKDAKAFEDFNKTIDDKSSVSKDKDLSTMILKNEAAVSWNDKKFAYVFENPFKSRYNYFDTTAPKGPDVTTLSSLSKNLFNLKEDMSMAKNEKLTNVLNEKGDIHLMYNMGAAMKSIPMMGMIGMLKADALLNNTITYTVSFDDGKVLVKHKFYGSKEMMDILKKYGTDNINSDMIKNIPSQNIVGAMACKFKPEGINEMIKLTGMDGMLNLQLSKAGFTMDDFVKAIKGDFVFSVSDLSMKTDTSYGYKREKPDMDGLFAVSIGDKASFDKIMNTVMKMKPQDSSISYGSNDKYFVIGNRKASVDKFLAGGNNSSPAIDKLKDHQFAMFVDINKILSSISPSVEDSTGKTVMDASLKFWDNVYSISGEMKDGAYSGSTEINMLDKKTNSLTQLSRYFNGVAKVAMERKKKNDAMMNVDTSAIQFTPPQGVK
jgi:hypothetical protein